MFIWPNPRNAECKIEEHNEFSFRTDIPLKSTNKGLTPELSRARNAAGWVLALRRATGMTHVGCRLQ